MDTSAPNAIQSTVPEIIWKDSRFALIFLLPIGMLLWSRGLIVGVEMIFEPYDTNISLFRNVAFDLVAVFIFFASMWGGIAIFQAVFLEPFEIFIVRWAKYSGGQFGIKGYYFKEVTFNSNDVLCVEKFVADNHFFGPKGSWRYGTLLTRNARAKNNYSLKVTLLDGRVFYFPGEMFEQEDPEELLGLLRG